MESPSARYRDKQRTTSASPRTSHVAQCNQGIASDPSRLAIRHVPSAPATQHLRIVGIEDLDQRHPWLDLHRMRLVLGCEPHGGGTDRLAVVAAVDSIADRGTPLAVHHTGLLNDPGQASAGIDHTGGDDRPGWTGVDAPTTRATSVRNGLDRRRKWCSGDDTAEHEPATCTRQQDVGVLAEPADTGPVRNLAVDDRVVVGKCNRSPAVTTQLSCDRSQALTQRCVVIGPCISRHAAVCPGGSRWLVRVIRAGADQHRLRPGDRLAGIGRTLRVLVRELQSIVQSDILSAEQLGPSSLEYLCVADTDVRDVVLLGDLDETTQVRGVNRRRRQRRSHCDAA